MAFTRMCCSKFARVKGEYVGGGGRGGEGRGEGVGVGYPDALTSSG